jgi:hypothetical protein
MKSTILVLLLGAALGVIFMLWRQNEALKNPPAAPAIASKPYPVGEMMGYLQRYTDKLWYAGDAGNWELAKFYHDEIAETAADIAAAHVVNDGIEVSQQVGELLPPMLAKIDQVIAAKDAAQFRPRYNELVATCNDCHAATKHTFIQIALPSGPSAHWNQRFAPQ